MLKMKPKWLHLLKIRKKRNQKWKQKMASGIHRRAAQSLSIAFDFSLPRCSRIRAAFKKTLSSSLLAGNRAFRKKQLP